MDASSTFWEACRAAYSLGLLVLGLAFLALLVTGGPPLLRVLRELTTALAAASAGLLSAAESRADRQHSLALLEAIADRVGARVPPRSDPPT